MPISEELKKKAQHYRDNVDNVKAEESRIRAEEQRKKAEQEKREKAKQNKEEYNRRLQESKRIIDNIREGRYAVRSNKNTRNAETFRNSVIERNKKQQAAGANNSRLINNEEQEKLIAENNSLPALSDEELQIIEEQTKAAQDTQRVKPVEQPPVEDIPTQSPTAPIQPATPRVPFNAQDYIKKNGEDIRRTLAKGGRLKARNGTSKIPTWQDILNAAEMVRVEKAQREQVLRNSRTESADYTTQSNDRTIVVNNNPNIQQEYNTHLPEFEGDPLVWDKAHPNLASWRNLVSASPYIIASAPLAAGVSGAAGTVGSAIARAAMSSRFAPVAKGIGTGLKWLNRGLTAGFAGHGIYDISQGNFTPMTALELAPIGIAGKALPAKLYDTETRAIEVAMRTGSSANPLELMGSTISSMLRGQAGGTKRLFDIGKYILTGAKTGSKGYYNSFAYTPKDYYKGFTNRIMPRLTATTGNDFIDAALYGKTIDPAYGMTKVATGKDFGFHVDHVKQEYPDKLKNIQVYELNSRNAVPESSVVPIGRPHGSIEDSHLFRTINGTIIDAGGHMEQFGIPVSIDVSNMTKPKFIKVEDSWGFIPKRYAAKYKLDEAPIYLRPLINFGLDRVYKHVTPVISKSKWQKFFEYAIDL